MKIGTAEEDSTFLTQGLSLKTALERRGVAAKVEIELSRSASVENAGRLQKNDIDFGFMASNWVGRAYRGEPPFLEPIDLRMTAPMNAGPLFFIALPNSGLATIADLRGRRVAIGSATSGMAQHGACIFSALGWSQGEVETRFLDLSDGARALARGEIDAQLQCPVPNKVITELTARTKVNVLAWPHEQLARVLAAIPFYRTTTMRAGTLPGLARDLDQPAVVNVLVTHARASRSTVRNVVRAIVEATNELERDNALFVGMRALFDPLRREGARALEFGGVPLHPGARDAYADLGLLRDNPQ